MRGRPGNEARSNGNDMSCQKRNGPKMAPHSTLSRKKWNGVPVLAAKNSTLLPKMELLANRQKRNLMEFGCQNNFSLKTYFFQ